MNASRDESGSGDDAGAQALALHRRLRGKIEVTAKVELSEDTLELVYTPGVGAVSRALADDPACATELTGRGNTVAVVSDGSAVLGLGQEGPVASLPVLEGKALLFRSLAGIDAIPIALDVRGADQFVDTVVALAPSFAAVNLEDIAAPDCFEIERRLQERLSIPIVHDDQHGTAIVVLAALLNAAKVTERELSEMSVVIAGAGAGGAGTARLLCACGVGRLTVTDSHGQLGPARDELDDAKRKLVEELELEGDGSLQDALEGAHAVIGLSSPDAFSVEDLERMDERPIVFALANPEPEVNPTEAGERGAGVVASGRSDFPNQVNNVLAFPGLFRGLLDTGLSELDDDASLRSARALANLVDHPSEEKILPSVLDERVVPAVAKAVAQED